MSFNISIHQIQFNSRSEVLENAFATMLDRTCQNQTTTTLMATSISTFIKVYNDIRQTFSVPL